jgi:hypothetical protein
MITGVYQITIVREGIDFSIDAVHNSLQKLLPMKDAKRVAMDFGFLLLFYGNDYLPGVFGVSAEIFLNALQTDYSEYVLDPSRSHVSLIALEKILQNVNKLIGEKPTFIQPSHSASIGQNYLELMLWSLSTPLSGHLPNVYQEIEIESVTLEDILAFLEASIKNGITTLRLGDSQNAPPAPAVYQSLVFFYN